MAVLELYGKCKELGYCDCGGFFGCVEPAPPLDKPGNVRELKRGMQADQETSDYKNHNLKYELALVDCEICDRSHGPDHPHIAKIDGDVPIDTGGLDDERQEATPAPKIPRELPDWLKDKPAASQAGATEQQLCQVCGKPWAPRHECIGGPAPRVRASESSVPRVQTFCEVCGKVKRSNHNCKGGAQDERIARELPKPVSIQTGAIGVTVVGQSFQVTRLTAAELKRLKQRKAPSKYQEILDLLMTLDIGEAILVPRGKVSADGLRAQTRKLPDRAFVSHLDDEQLTIIRSK